MSLRALILGYILYRQYNKYKKKKNSVVMKYYRTNDYYKLSYKYGNYYELFLTLYIY